MRGLVLSAVVAASFTACLTAPAPIISSGHGGSGQSPGSAGDIGTGGDTSGGAGVTGSAGTMEGTGGMPTGTAGDTGAAGTGGTSTGRGGTTGAGGTVGSGGAAAGTGGTESGGTAGAAGRGGTTGAAGTTGGAGRGGTTGTAGTTGAAGRGGTTGSAGTTGGAGTGGTTSPAAAVDGLRVDDVCGNLLAGNVCLHKGKATDDGTPFSAMKAVTMGGTTGTTYQVKLHFRGVVEPTHIMSGTTGTPTTFITGGARYGDGTQEATYQQWRLTTTNPNQHYYLNAYNAVGLSHVVNLIDYTETIPIAAGATVTLDVFDGNAHAISNTVNSPPLAPSGVPGSMNAGQFIQINVDGVM